jgi:hypothetical protein
MPVSQISSFQGTAVQFRPDTFSSPISPRFPPAFVCFGGLGLAVCWLVLIAVLGNMAIRPDEITGTRILLNGVSEEFVQAVEDAEIERRVRLRQRQVEDEAEAAPHRHGQPAEPPRKPPLTEAIEEARPPRPAPPPDAFEA